MEFADLARWTPVHVDFSGPSPTVDWANLSEERFVEPFFDQTAARWAVGPRASQLVRTGIDALVALDDEPSLEPAGMVFHMSRCGSTLVSRLLGTLPGVVVVSEPSPLNSLLGLGSVGVEHNRLVEIVRLLVRALGRCRHGDERQLVLKCTSWNIRHRAVLAAAFPDAPWVWVQRDPAYVLASLLAEPPGWLHLHNWPQRAKQLFGFDPAAVAGMSPVEFGGRALGAMLEAAGADDPNGRLCIDYSDLPDAIWLRAAAHFGLEVDGAAVHRMTNESQFYSKSATPRVFAGDVAKSGRITDEVRSAAEQFAQPAYRALASAH